MLQLALKAGARPRAVNWRNAGFSRHACRLRDIVVCTVIGFARGAMNAEAHTVRRIEVLLAEYEQNHNNPTNKVIHCFAVPVIAWAALAILWYLPTPSLFDLGPYLNWAT